MVSKRRLSCWKKLSQSLSQNVAFSHSIAEIEAMVAIKALEFALEIGINKAIMEGS